MKDLIFHHACLSFDVMKMKNLFRRKKDLTETNGKMKKEYQMLFQNKWCYITAMKIQINVKYWYSPCNLSNMALQLGQTYFSTDSVFIPGISLKIFPFISCRFVNKPAENSDTHRLLCPTTGRTPNNVYTRLRSSG